MKNKKPELDKFRQKRVNQMIGDKICELRINKGFKKRGDFITELEKYGVYIEEETYRSYETKGVGIPDIYKLAIIKALGITEIFDLYPDVSPKDIEVPRFIKREDSYQIK